MSTDLLDDQVTKRAAYLEAILDSPSRRKLIVAGPGTGKTFTFGRLLERNVGGDNLALTFIRKLVMDMESEFEGMAEAKTFHAYCKKLLHEKYGGVELFPALTQVVEEDSELLGRHLANFNDAFQTLEEEAEELSFYLKRGDYYRAVSFDDSVYRVLVVVRDDKDFMPRYDQIVIDEFQDFNPLEVAFIEELEQRGSILIVGDDDQAVYRQRNSSPDHLRAKFTSGGYDTFELPFCTRCPRVVVEATTGFISSIMDAGAFESRIDRPFVPYFEGKEHDNERYPKIITATTSNILCSAKLVRLAIDKIPVEDIDEANKEDYPCVLIVGLRQYLNPLKKELTKHFSNVVLRQAESTPYSLVNGYELLLRDHHSNLGWRLLAGLELPNRTLKELIESSLDLSALEDLLPKEFVERHKTILDKLREPNLDDSVRNDLEELLGEEAALVVGHFFPPEDEEPGDIDLTEPSILLSSFEGCKGLSAGHVFVVGFNNGIMPRIEGNEIHDIEISKFIVAMTRTRKQLYLVSNRWDYAPRGDSFLPSEFIQYLPSEALLAAGYLKSPDVDTFIESL